MGDADSTDGLTSDKLYGLDLSDSNSSLSFPLDLEANSPPFIERVGIDLDEIASVTGYKVVTKVYPQVTTSNANQDFNFTFARPTAVFGSANIPAQNHQRYRIPDCGLRYVNANLTLFRQWWP